MAPLPVPRSSTRGAATPDMPSDAIYTVTEVYPTHVVLDGIGAEARSGDGLRA